MISGGYYDSHPRSGFQNKPHFFRKLGGNSELEAARNIVGHSVIVNAIIRLAAE